MIRRLSHFIMMSISCNICFFRLVMNSLGLSYFCFLMKYLSGDLLFGVAFEMRVIPFHLIHLRTPMNMLLFSFAVIFKTTSPLLGPKSLHDRHDHQLFFILFKMLLGLFFLLRIFYSVDWNKDGLSFPILNYRLDIKHAFGLVPSLLMKFHLL